MTNIDGKICENSEAQIALTNRGYMYGDMVFETIKVIKGKILFWEDHYFRLMASMRIMRMEIPMSFTLEFLQEEILKTIKSANLNSETARIKITVARLSEGYYLPSNNTEVVYSISVEPLANETYAIPHLTYEVELYKDNYVAPSILSTLKTNNKALNVLASIYANENGYDNCLLLNTEKQVIEGTNANLFLVKDNRIKTPPLTDGCLNGIMRKQISRILGQMANYEFEEASISPFELQKADELFLTNVISGIQPISKYRKKHYTTKVSVDLIEKLNKNLETQL